MTDQSKAIPPPTPPEKKLDMRWLVRAGSIVILLGLFLAFALQNSETVEVEFLWWSFETARVVLLIGSAVVGVLIWELAGFVRRRRRRAT